MGADGGVTRSQQLTCSLIVELILVCYSWVGVLDVNQAVVLKDQCWYIWV